MKCESCSTEVSNKMKHSIASNVCPFCGGKIMPDMKAEQYINLLEVLDQTSFTNRSDIDTQIREKIASLLITNFIFKKLDLPKVGPDIIVIDDSPVSIPNVAPPVTKALTSSAVPPPTVAPVATQVASSPQHPQAESDLNSLPSRSIARVPLKAASPQSSTAFSVADYARFQDETYNDASESDTPTLADIDGLTPEEILRAFPELSIQDIQGMKEEAIAMGTGQRQSQNRPQRASQSTTSGSGIKRLNR